MHSTNLLLFLLSIRESQLTYIFKVSIQSPYQLFGSVQSVFISPFGGVNVKTKAATINEPSIST